MSSQRSNPHGQKRPRIGERTMLACTHCKQKKLKCDAQSPRCHNCVRTGRECLVEDPATGQHRPRDYMQSLESRVAYLESLLQLVRPDVALDHFPPSHDQRQSTPGHAGPLDQAQRAGSHDPEQNMDVLSSEVALLCLSAAGREPHYFGPSSALSFSRIVSTTLGLTKRGSSSQQDVNGPDLVDQEMRRSQKPRFPSPRVAAALSEAYFNNIHPQYPFLHRPTFNHWEQECTAANVSGDLETAKPMSLFFTLMVYAIGSLVTSATQRDSAEGYYYMALDYIAPVLDLETFESLQAILCCAVFSVRSPVGVSLWKISGMAIRQCIELGYHRSAAKYRKHADPLTVEISKRIFWVAYDIDRVAGLILGRPFGIPDEAIDVELPLDIDDENVTRDGFLRGPRIDPGDPPTNMTGALHVIGLRRLWSRFAGTLYRSISRRDGVDTDALIDGLRRELEEWHASIPDQLFCASTHPLSVFASRDWFHLAYEHSILLLYRHHMTGEQQVTSQDPAERRKRTDRIFEECASSARQMCIRYRRLYQSSSIQFTWGSLHILFLAGLTYLFCLWRCARVREKSRQIDVVNTCMACTMVLTVTAERWNFATPYRDIFELLSVKTISMVCGDAELPVGGGTGLGAGLGAGLGDVLGGPGSSAEALGPPVPELASFQDWLAGLGDVPIPAESEWLVEELLNGIRDFEANPAPAGGNNDMSFFTGGRPLAVDPMVADDMTLGGETLGGGT